MLLFVNLRLKRFYEKCINYNAEALRFNEKIGSS